MARKISKTRRVANISNPTGPGGKFYLSDDSDAVIFGNSNNTSIKFGKLNVGRFQIAHNSNNTDDFYRTSRGILQGLQNQPDSDLYNRFSSTNNPFVGESPPAATITQFYRSGFRDAILGSDSDTTTTFKGQYLFKGDDNIFPTTDRVYNMINAHRKFPLDSDSLYANGTSIANDFLIKKKIGRYVERSNVIFGRKHGGQTINIARVSGETTPLQFGYPKSAANVYDSENTVFTSFGTLDLQGRVIFKATDVTFGFLGDDSDSDSGFYLERRDDGSYDTQQGGQNRQNMNAQNEQAMSSFIQPKQVVGKSYVRFLNSTSSPLTGTGTFRIAPLYDSDGDGSFGNRSRRTNMTVTGNIADSDGTLALQGNEGRAVFDSDGFTIGSTKISIPSKYNLTVINAAGSTVATFKFLDPST